MMRRVLIVYKVQDADFKPTELSQIAGGGIANKSLDKECRYLALTPFALPSLLAEPSSLIFLGELPQRAINCSHRNPREF